MPGYTHLQRAQPVYLGHHMLAWFWMALRDRERFAAVARQANDSAFGLVASVWTRDLRTAHRLAELIRAGVVGINHHGSGDVYAPFGGFGESGWGREFGAESMDLYLEPKTVVVRYD